MSERELCGKCIISGNAACCVFKDEFGLILLAEVLKCFTQEEMFELGKKGIEICWEVKEDKERLVKVPMTKKC